MVGYHFVFREGVWQRWKTEDGRSQGRSCKDGDMKTKQQLYLSHPYLYACLSFLRNTTTSQSDPRPTDIHTKSKRLVNRES